MSFRVGGSALNPSSARRRRNLPVVESLPLSEPQFPNETTTGPTAQHGCEVHGNVREAGAAAAAGAQWALRNMSCGFVLVTQFTPRERRHQLPYQE